MLKPVTGLAVAVVGVVGAMVAPAGAQQYPPADNGISVDCTTPAPGETITVTAHTFLPGADVLVTLDPDAVPLGTGAAGGEGAVLFEATIPADTAPGDRTITAVGEADEGLLTLTARITVVDGDTGCEDVPDEAAPAGAAPGGAAPSDDSGGGALAFTGSSLTMLLLQIGLALAAAGGLFLALAARRRRTAHLAA